MQAERWQQVERLCQAALDHAPNERAAFLNEACADDEELRREVESGVVSLLLQRHTVSRSDIWKHNCSACALALKFQSAIRSWKWLGIRTCSEPAGFIREHQADCGCLEDTLYIEAQEKMRVCKRDPFGRRIRTG